MYAGSLGFKVQDVGSMGVTEGNIEMMEKTTETTI